MTIQTSLWTALPIPTLIVGDDDRIRDLNPAAEQFLNSSVRTLRGQLMLDRILVNADIDNAFSRVRSGGAQFFINNVDVSTDATPPTPCNIQVTNYEDAGAVLVLFEPRQLVDRMGLGQASKSAAKSAIGMSEMLAHEIKNPLAGITGAAQLLAMNLRSEDQELTDLIVEESRRIVQLLTEVEQFGNRRPPQLKPLNIHDVLDRARKSTLVGFGAGMEIIQDYDPSLPSTLGDQDQLLQVFLNLLKNGSQAAGTDGGEIRIRTFYDFGLRAPLPDGTMRALPLQIEIIDNGPGVPEELGRDIFDPFVSGRENGTGLGLALVSKIVADHGGWIDVDSVPGRTAFRISLPLAPKETAVMKEID